VIVEQSIAGDRSGIRLSRKNLKIKWYSAIVLAYAKETLTDKKSAKIWKTEQGKSSPLDSQRHGFAGISCSIDAGWEIDGAFFTTAAYIKSQRLLFTQS
jgi:hypothetical protein